MIEEKNEIYKEKKHNVLAVIGFIGFVIVVAITIYFTSTYFTSKTVITNSSQNIQEDTSNDKLNQIKILEDTKNGENTQFSKQKKVALILSNGSIDDCSSFASKDYQKTCRDSFVYKELQESNYENIDVCNRLENSQNILDCNYLVVFSKQSKNLTLEVCDESTYEEVKKECQRNYYFQAAIKYNDISYCQKVSNVKDCENNYLIYTKLISNYKTFDCMSLNGDKEKSECETLQNTSKDHLTNECQGFSTRVLDACYKIAYS